MNKTPETDDLARGNHVVPTEWAEQLERERDEARGELNALATSIQKSEYSDAKEFELLGSVAGVISQIDNMYAGVRQQRDEARADAAKIADILSGLELRSTEELARLEQERNEWRKKFELSVDAVEIAARLARSESERDEAREAFKISYNERVQMELERDEARKKYDTLAVENMLEVHKLCKERDEWAAMCGRYKQERDEARDIIRKAKAKFCEDGEDGKIASEMFSILIGNI